MLKYNTLLGQRKRGQGEKRVSLIDTIFSISNNPFYVRIEISYVNHLLIVGRFFGCGLYRTVRDLTSFPSSSWLRRAAMSSEEVGTGVKIGIAAVTAEAGFISTIWAEYISIPGG